MKSSRPIRVALGPQSPRRNIAEAVAAAGLPDGPLAFISAGWQEGEGDVEEVEALLGRTMVDLGLYRRAEQLFGADERIGNAARERQARLVEQQYFYRLRLKQLSIAARNTLGAEGDAELLAAEQRHAVSQLRALDRHHLHRCEALWRQFRDEFDPGVHEPLARQVEEIGHILDGCAGVVISGGNVAVLINRMRLFDMDRMLPGLHVVAWSAGAMALTERIVLFHDRAPEGRRDAELLGAGCGVLPGLVFLPDAQHRLRTRQQLRVSLMSRRFSPDVCVTLDNGTALYFDDDTILRVDGARRLNHDGRISNLRAA